MFLQTPGTSRNRPNRNAWKGHNRVTLLHGSNAVISWGLCGVSPKSLGPLHLLPSCWAGAPRSSAIHLLNVHFASGICTCCVPNFSISSVTKSLPKIQPSFCQKPKSSWLISELTFSHGVSDRCPFPIGWLIRGVCLPPHNSHNSYSSVSDGADLVIPSFPSRVRVRSSPSSPSASWPFARRNGEMTLEMDDLALLGCWV